jgi:hypothetical protein
MDPSSSVVISNCHLQRRRCRTGFVGLSLPNGIEFDLAEVASGTTRTMASIASTSRAPTFISMHCGSRAQV